MAGIYHQIGVTADISDVHKAISTLEGLSNWWTLATGGTDQDDKLTFHFNEHKVEMMVIESITDKKVVWQNVAEDGEWKDTLFTFNLVPADDQVFINFSHTEWAEQTDFCAHCSTKWAVFMLSLKDYLEKGKGQPFPDDVPINHM